MAMTGMPLRYNLHENAKPENGHNAKFAVDLHCAAPTFASTSVL